jgi:multidrug efflux system outer membrane protein
MSDARRSARIVAGMLAFALLAAGCATPTETSSAVDVPTGWRSEADTTASLGDLPWGELFRTAELETLVREALANNADLRIAAERIEVARAQYGFERAALVPAVAADAAYTRARQPALGPSNTIAESSSLGLAVPSWEIDLWGRIRSATESARRQLLAAEETRRALYISLIGQVATGYLALLDLDTQVDVARSTVDARAESLRVVKARFEGGITAASDLRQAESNLAAAEAAVAGLERSRAQAENGLSVLIGRNPGPVVRAPRALPLATPPRLPAGLPSALLTRRPDVVAAEQQIRAADASVDAARKAYLPTISLTGFLGFASPALKDLFDEGRSAWSVAPAVTLPVFTGGRLQANVEAADAQRRIALEQYRQTVRNAFREVDDTLVAYQRNIEQRAALERVVRANRERARLADLRYRNGVTIYLEVLLAQQQTFESELQLSQANRAVYESVVNLYAALGGGWDPSAGAPVAPPGVPQ